MSERAHWAPTPPRTRPTGRALAGAFALLIASWSATPSRALADEPWLLALETSIALPITAPQSDTFGLGVGGAISVLRPLAPWAQIGARFRGLLLSDAGQPDPTRRDYGLGGLMTLSLAGRFRPVDSANDARRTPGFFVDIEGGIGVTGTLVRPAFAAGAGYGISLGDVTLSPIVRWALVIQLSEPLESRSAHLLLLGIELQLFDAQNRAPPPPPRVELRDRDRDGLLDRADGCPDEAEDRDGFGDEDGCPDPDDDADRVLDASDACPRVPEDPDGFDDGDGCPDPDNDHDGVLDAADACPTDRETINGNDDTDGCPDEGLIEMVDDRVVIDESILFELNRSRVKSSARPVLAAFVALYGQNQTSWERIRVEGHADATGNEAFNQELSERRAVNVREALIELGIPEDRIEAAGFGATQLRDQRTTDGANARNRRVEIAVIRRVRMGDMAPPVAPTETTPGGGAR